MMRVAVVGSSGQLGTDLVEALMGADGFALFPLDHSRIECTDPRSVRHALAEARPDAVVNCTGFVSVDECEGTPERAFSVNAGGALHIARACAELNAKCVYISTDYVFDGRKTEPYTENDVPNPINVYGASKLAGEYLVRQACSDWLIVRMASLFGKVGARGKGGNFLDTILSKARAREPIRVVQDVTISPTYAHDAAQGIEGLLRAGANDIVHLVNAGSCTWYEFARKAIELSGLTAEVAPISSSEFSMKARRPAFSALITARPFKALRSWEDALSAYLVEKGVLVG